VTSLSDEDLVSVAGPWWALRPDRPVYRDARLAAARDAMVRAREYAEAFGGGIAGLIEAADAGLLTSAATARPSRARRRAITAPRPRELPVTRATRPCATDISRSFHAGRRDDLAGADGGEGLT
jgi:uncharacterized protein YggE